MKYRLLYIIAALITALPFTACDNDQELPPMIMPAVQGNGTVESPFNVAAAIAQARVNGEESDISYFTKGVVTSSSIDVSYGNGEFEIEDKPGSGETALKVYRAKDLDNQKFTSADKVQVGDTIIVYAPIINFKGNTPETNYGYLYAINGQKSSTTPADPTPSNPGSPDTPSPSGSATPSGDGTEASPYNCAKALEVANALTADQELKDKYAVGVVTAIKEIDTGQYGNATYTIGDEGFTSTFSVYRGYYLNGDKFTSDDQLKVGDKVLVKGTIVNFKGNTPQFTTGSSIVKIEQAAK